MTNRLLAPLGVFLQRGTFVRTYPDRSYPMTRALAAAGAFADDPAVLIDVGCAGGIDPRWRAFGAALRAVGIDADSAECARLSAVERNPNVGYRGAFLVAGMGAPAGFRRNPWGRLSVAQAVSRPAAASSPGGPSLTVADLITEERLDHADFIKIDVDGPDYELLMALAPLLGRLGVLGLQLEVNFFGTADEGTHCFHNMDRLLRRHGYELFDLSTRHYSCAALPAPFIYPEPGPTTFGRIYQGDALYLRDPAGDPPGGELAPAALRKLACIYELYELPDCAAELIHRFPDSFVRHDPAHLLDCLVPMLDGMQLSYPEYRRRVGTEAARLR